MKSFCFEKFKLKNLLQRNLERKYIQKRNVQKTVIQSITVSVRAFTKDLDPREMFFIHLFPFIKKKLKNVRAGESSYI